MVITRASIRTAIAILFLTIGRITTAATNTESPSPELLEPIVKRHALVLPLSVCEELIQLGEAKGFTVDEESIDADEENRDPSQSIEVFERDDGITSPAIWAALEPWIPQLTDLVKASIDTHTDSVYFPDKSDRTPELGWVFFRKYSPSSDRKSLKLHVDSNMHTLNIALNGQDDSLQKPNTYKGGGVFYVKPPALQEVESLDGRPHIPEQYLSYRWLNKVKRENSSDIVFPKLEGGDVLIHNFTVWHAVAPIEVGTRYSFVLFYDMDNPAIQNDFDLNDDDALPVVFYNGMTQNIDLVFAYESGEGKEIVDVMEDNMSPGEQSGVYTYEGHVFRAMVHGTDTTICEFVIREEQKTYTIEQKEVPNNLSDEF